MSISIAVPRSISWKGDSIALLNETKLSTIVEYKALTTIEDIRKNKLK